MIYFYGRIGRSRNCGPSAMPDGSPQALLMGSLDPVRRVLRRKSGAARARLERGANGRVRDHAPSDDVGLCSWAIVHLAVVGTAKALVFDGALLILAVFGSVGQDAKKRKLMGERWHEWVGADCLHPFGRGFSIRARSR